MSPTYQHNSPSKDFIRNKWVEYITAVLTRKGKDLEIIDLPAEEMQDIHLFVNRGLLSWEQTETGAFRFTKGRVVCFEKNQNIEMALSQKFVDLKVYPEIASHLQVNYHKIKTGAQAIFPVDTINLDFDGNISKNRTGISQLLKLIFEFQGQHGADFCLFLTFPNTENEDDSEFKDQLKGILSSNLIDEYTQDFKNGFTAKYKTIESMDYEPFLIVSISKMIIKESSSNFKILTNEFFTYGEDRRMRMVSVLFDFKYIGAAAAGHGQYFTEVMKALEPINEVSTEDPGAEVSAENPSAA